MSLYAWLMLFSFIGPFALSFDKKVAFYKNWPGLFLGIFLNGLIFILWDGWFVREGVWGFNPDFIHGLSFNNLPVEEWLFFIVVPYASVFIYSCIKAYVPNQPLENHSNKITLFAAVVILLLAVLNYDKLYTLVNCSVAFLLLLFNYLVLKPKYMGYFWVSYFIHLIPFLIVNGILTGAVTPEPVVWYNNEENLGIRIYTIPVEDTIYALTCLLLPINVMEYLNSRVSKDYSITIG
jgi:lycopene cyclase domain-containing protein